MICAYCGYGTWRINLRGLVECASCAAPQPQMTLDEIVIERAAVGYPVVYLAGSDTYAGKIEEWHEQFYKLKLEIGNSLIPFLVPAVETIAKIIHD